MEATLGLLEARSSRPGAESGLTEAKSRLPRARSGLSDADLVLLEARSGLPEAWSSPQWAGLSLPGAGSGLLKVSSGSVEGRETDKRTYIWTYRFPMRFTGLRPPLGPKPKKRHKKYFVAPVSVFFDTLTFQNCLKTRSEIIPDLTVNRIACGGGATTFKQAENQMLALLCAAS